MHWLLDQQREWRRSFRFCGSCCTDTFCHLINTFWSCWQNKISTLLSSRWEWSHVESRFFFFFCSTLKVTFTPGRRICCNHLQTASRLRLCTWFIFLLQYKKHKSKAHDLKLQNTTADHAWTEQLDLLSFLRISDLTATLKLNQLQLRSAKCYRCKPVCKGLSAGFNSACHCLVQEMFKGCSTRSLLAEN